MAWRLARLPQKVAIVDPPSGKPTMTYQRWQQTHAEKTESAINDIIDILTRLGLVEVTADGALELADSAINPDGTIKTSKVVTDSVATAAVTDGDYTTTTGTTTLTNLTEVDVISHSVTKAIDASDIRLTANLRMQSSDDIIGTFKLYRDATLLDTVPYDCRTNGSVYKALIPYAYVDDAATAGSYTYKLTFTRNGGGSTVTADPGCLLEHREFKR